MLRTSLVSAAILSVLGPAAPARAADLASSFVVERTIERPGRGRVRDVPRLRPNEAAIIDIVFGMSPRIGDSATETRYSPAPQPAADPARGFVAAAGRAGSVARTGVIIARGARPGSAALCPAGPGGLDAVAGDVIPVRLR